MDWVSFNWGVLAGFLLIMVIWFFARHEEDPEEILNRLNQQGFQDIIDRANADWLALYGRYIEVRDAVEALRAAQRAYMADRGNDELGRAVGEAAAIVDAVMAKHDA